MVELKRRDRAHWSRERRTRSSVGRRQADAKIVSIRPWWPILFTGIGISVIIFSSWIGYYFGLSRYDHYSIEKLVSERKVLIRKNRKLFKEKERLTGQVLSLSKELEINEGARARLQQEFKQYYDNLASLQNEIIYYKRVLKPGTEDKGIVLGGLEIKKLSKDRTYRIELDVLQVNSMKKLKGSIEFKVSGHLNGNKESFDFDTLNATEESKFKLSFKNFQTVRSEVELPPGYVPEQLAINARFKSGKKLTVSRIYDWIVQES